MWICEMFLINAGALLWESMQSNLQHHVNIATHMREEECSTSFREIDQWQIHFFFELPIPLGCDINKISDKREFVKMCV